MNKYEDVDLNLLLDSIPKEELLEMSEKEMNDAKNEYQEFLTELKKGKCYLCGKSMNDLTIDSPCFHWFTYPNGIKKKYFTEYLKTPIGFFELNCYLRWLANSEQQMANINSLSSETSKNSAIECTYKFRNVEWAFSVGNTDKEGHKSGRVGNVPHYHIQMKVDGKQFINFNDFHIPFSDNDLFKFKLEEQTKGKVKLVYPFGAGTEILEDENLDANKFDENLNVTYDDQDKAPIRRQSIITSVDDNVISGDLIADAIEESKKTKEPVGRIVQRKLGEKVNVMTVISPSDVIPQMEKRSGKK